jgi:hypothetical protein
MAESECSHANDKLATPGQPNDAGWPRASYRLKSSAAMLVALTAIVPPVLVVVTVLIAIVVTLVISRSGDHACRRECNQPQQNSASKNALCICHVCSSG